MTSEAHRLEATPPAVSVKARAQEIEARALASGKGPSTPVAPKEEPQVTPDRRRSEGDIFLRCKPRSTPPPVAPKLRRVSLEHATLPTVLERSPPNSRTVLSSVLESTTTGERLATVPTTAATCQASNLAPFTSRGDVTDGFSPAIFSRSLPIPQQHSPLDDIITALEKICDEFAEPDNACRTDPGGGRRFSSSDQRPSLQRANNNDDVFERELAGQSTSYRYGPSQEAACQVSEKQFFNEEFNYVNPTFFAEESEPILYRSALLFTPKSPQVTPTRHGVERSSGLTKSSTQSSEDCNFLKLDQEEAPHNNEASSAKPPLNVKKAVVAFKPDLPKILTSSSGRNPDRKGPNGTRRDSSPSEELEIVKNILAKLDFQKYKRRLSLDTDRKTSAMEEKSPKPPPRIQKPSGGKFKDLFDILKSNPESSGSKKSQFVLSRSLSFSNAEENTYTERDEMDKKLSENPNKLCTLPRRKCPTSQPIKKGAPPSVLSVASCPSIMKLSDLRLDPTLDEGLASDSDYVTSSPTPSLTSSRLDHYRTDPDPLSTFHPHSSRIGLLRSDSEASANQATDKQRKRRKGISKQPDTAKSGTGRSLTYPPQKKGSVDEGVKFTSVDSNGMKSLKTLTEGLARPDSARLLSDLSLADSQLCPSEGTVDETYQDIVDSVLHSPTDPQQYLSVDGKPHKKKHHSDPGGDASSPTSSEASFIADTKGSSRSEPELGETSSRATQTSEASEDHPQLKLVIDANQGRGGRAYASGSLTSGATPSSHFLFPESGSPHRAPIDSSKSPQEQRRYSKRRLRGPYGEMLEEEMRKSGEKQKTAYSDLSFLQDIAPGNQDASTTMEPPTTPRPAMFLSSQSLDDASSTSSRNELSMCVTPKRKISANYPLLSDGDGAEAAEAQASDEAQATPEKKEEKTSPQQKAKRDSVRNSSQDRSLDTRTHVVYEILETERSYVDSLQTLVTMKSVAAQYNQLKRPSHHQKYMGALKSTDYNGVVEGGIVDEIFFQVPEILSIHDEFLDALSSRCSNWDIKFTIGDLFIEAFTKQQVIDTYTAFINNWKCAKDATKIATQAKPSFARFLEHMSREHKGKLALDALLIMPVQRIPRYELLLKELLKHTPVDHPDHHLLVQAQKEVHDLAVKINRVEREAFQIEQMQARVKEIEHHIDGVVDLCVPDRAFIRHDVVTIPGGLGTKKERCLFLFSDILLITSIKRKSAAMRKPSSTPAPSTSQSPFSVIDTNKYKLLTKFSIESMEISKNTDVSLKKAMRDIATLEEDIQILNQIKELVDRISSSHQNLEDIVRDLTNSVSKQMLEKQNNDYSLISLEMTVTTQERIENLTIQFTSPERRAVWSAAFNEAKLKLGRRPPPELRKAMPIRKTRAGLQFTCATATLGYNQQGLREVWVCNSDGYVGQVCVLSLLPEPTVMSCNGVCNARILTIASVPATCSTVSDRHRWRPTVPDNDTGVSIEIQEVEDEGAESLANNGNIQLDSESSDDDDDMESADEEKGENRKRGNSIPRDEGQEDMDIKQPTMWLGTEDGCVHVYNCNDNIRTKKNKIKIQHVAAIQCIIYLDSRVFVSIANGEVHVYKKESEGGWAGCEPSKVVIGSLSSPVTIMLAVAGKIWCGCQNSIHVLNTGTLIVEHSFPVSSDTSRYVLCMVTSGLGVWITVTPSAVIRLFHATNFEPLIDVNVAPTVAKILSAATDDIIKQHKSACLRVTAMLACKDLLWIGTSAGVILTLPLPHLTSSTLSVDIMPPLTGLPHGHTGHVRFLTSVETSSGSTLDATSFNKYSFRASKSKESATGRRTSTTASAGLKILVISGGDGYEDFETSGLGEQAGHDDSTNHLLLWHV